MSTNDSIERLLQSGLDAQQRGDWARARSSFAEILHVAPKHGQALYLHALVDASEGLWKEARDGMVKAQAVLQEDPGLLSNLAAAHLALDDPFEAERVLRRAIELDPGHVDALVHLGIALRKQMRPGEALLPVKAALSKEPGHSRARHTLGNLLEDLTRKALEEHNLEEADDYLSVLAKVRPDGFETILFKGNLALQRRSLDEAYQHYRKAMELNPAEADIHANMGTLLAMQLDLKGALAGFDQAIALRPDHAPYRFNRGLVHLLEGNFQEGWSDYEHRQLADGSIPGGTWQGCTIQDLKDRQVHVLSEQGFGDTIQFVRYVKALEDYGISASLSCQPELRRLFQHSFSFEVQDHASPLDGGLRIPLMSLPGLFRTDLSTIPAPVPYLSVRPRNVSSFEDIRQGEGIRVGLAWKGRPTHHNDGNRSIEIGRFQDIFALPGVHFFSLQKGEGTEDLKGRLWPVQDLSPRLRDFEDTAAAISCLDLVLTVDTAVAHLAGAMGKRVWTLLPFCPDWRWLLETNRSPWYPTMRLFRQPAVGEWSTPLEEVREALIQEGL